QGVDLREQEGPVLRPNQTFALDISANDLDGDGQRLGKVFTKKFRTIAEEHRCPLPQEWTLSSPAAGSVQPLSIAFPRPLDRALLDRSLKVVDSHGKPIAGKVTIGAEEKSWLFRPDQPW